MKLLADPPEDHSGQTKLTKLRALDLRVKALDLKKERNCLLMPTPQNSTEIRSKLSWAIQMAIIVAFLTDLPWNFDIFTVDARRLQSGVSSS